MKLKTASPMTMKIWFFLTVIALALAGCARDECREHSDFSCKRIQKGNYNVHFHHPDGREEYLGQTRGLAYCGRVARGFAASRGLSDGSEWSYVCCMRAKGSECYEKHQPTPE